MALAQGITRHCKILHNVFRTATRNYCDSKIKSLGKKILVKGGAGDQAHELPVETDTQILVNYVCGTKLFEESGENVKIKPDSEYPEWLWTMHTGKPKELHELEPDSLEYWKRVRKLGLRARSRLNSMRSDKRDYK